MMSADGWLLANQQLVAKSLQELSYEQVLNAAMTAPNEYRLDLQSGVNYTFTAWRGIWTDLKIQRESIRRNGQMIESAGQFFIDIQKETEMDDIILANFLEEMHNSLYADLALQKKSTHHLVNELVEWDGERIQSLLSGHPKILISKGRMGWSAEDQDKFGPENEKPVQLLWLAARKNKTLTGFSSELTQDSLLLESMSSEELTRFKTHLQTNGLVFEDYNYIPVHPWQWDRYIQIQFAGDIHMGNLVFLGTFGDHYLPQISLRTFSNISRPKKMDIKLPMTVLNTSAIRGIPAKYIPQGHSLSADFLKLIQQDDFLSTANTGVLAEMAGIFYGQSLFAQVKEAPYRYHELLGAIWRKSSASQLKDQETAIIAGSLFHKDRAGQSLIGAYIRKSGLSIEEWLKKYFESVVLPLYHLQVQHGVGLVAHGQNIVVRLKNYVPTGLLLKDFQGDLRLTTDSKALSHDLTRLPPHYLIHDLITGHFVTVLRYISETLQTCDCFAEKDFYRLLGETLQSYLAKNASVTSLPHFSGVDLLAKTFPRVLVNRVRFKIGYADSAERPLPILGDELKNPIYLGLHRLEHSEAKL